MAEPDRGGRGASMAPMSWMALPAPKYRSSGLFCSLAGDFTVASPDSFLLKAKTG